MKQIQPSRRGRLKVFLSYAAGAGKTFRMLEEAQELKKQGVDIVVGYFEPHGRKDTIEKTEGLEIIPRRKLEYRGAGFEEMDTDAIIRRAPKICPARCRASRKAPRCPPLHDTSARWATRRAAIAGRGWW